MIFIAELTQPNSSGPEPSGTAAYDSITGPYYNLYSHQSLPRFPADWCFEHLPLNTASNFCFDFVAFVLIFFDFYFLFFSH
jgi:hypothetical protein